MTTLYSTTQTFSKIDGPRIFSVQANGGSVTWAVEHGDGSGDWIDVKTYSADTAEEINFGDDRTHRFTVSGSATYVL